MKWAKIPFTDIPLEASKDGRVRYSTTKLIVKCYTKKSGYQFFRTMAGGKEKTVYVHRCVLAAHAAIDGYEKLDVHHKDHNPSNNRLGNLVWCTPRENALYSLADGRLEYSKLKASENARNQLKNGTHAFFNLTPEQHRLKYINRSKNYEKKGNHPNKGRTGLMGTNVKLTKEKIRLINRLYDKGWKMGKIAREVGLSVTPIRNVVKGLVKYI